MPTPASAELLDSLAATALAALRREYPYQQSHRSDSDADAVPHRQLHPIFYGAYDWHSSVHGHWTLVRLLRLHPNGRVAAESRASLDEHLRAENVAAELDYLARPGREGFERPYGLAWLLQLCAELREWGSDEASRWQAILAPLEAHAARRIDEWLATLPRPIRGGEHSQSAFAMGLALDWARIAGATDLEARITTRALTFHAGDRDAPIAWEPSAYDFLSPTLAEADLMRRVQAPAAFTEWLEAFLPPSDALAGWLTPLVAADSSDGKLAHWTGLNASRAWMLEGIAGALRDGTPARARFAAAAATHREAALADLRASEYEVTHWLASFVTYLVTGRGGAFA